MIGFEMVMAGLIGVCVAWNRHNTGINRTTLPGKIGIGLIAFIFLIQGLLICLLPLSDGYKVSQVFLRNDTALAKQVGVIDNCSFTPWGAGMEYHDTGNVGSGSGAINWIVKGSKRYADVTVYVVKETTDTAWRVDSYEVEF